MYFIIISFVNFFFLLSFARITNFVLGALVWLFVSISENKYLSLYQLNLYRMDSKRKEHTHSQVSPFLATVATCCCYNMKGIRPDFMFWLLCCFILLVHFCMFGFFFAVAFPTIPWENFGDKIKMSKHWEMNRVFIPLANNVQWRNPKNWSNIATPSPLKAIISRFSCT